MAKKQAEPVLGWNDTAVIKPLMRHGDAGGYVDATTNDGKFMTAFYADVKETPERYPWWKPRNHYTPYTPPVPVYGIKEEYSGSQEDPYMFTEYTIVKTHKGMTKKVASDIDTDDDAKKILRIYKAQQRRRDTK